MTPVPHQRGWGQLPGTNGFLLAFNDAEPYGVEWVDTNGLLDLSDLSTVQVSSLANNDVLQYVLGAWRNRSLAAAGIAAASHTHAASDVSSGSFADARISESSVTQHGDAIHAGGIRTGTTPPSSPAAGDVYYDTNDETLYTYDATRAHWLGPLQWTDFNRNSSMSDGENLRTGGDAMSSIGSRGLLMPYECVVVGMRCDVNTSSAFTGSFEIYYGASATGVTVAFSSSTGEQDLTLDYDLSTAEALGVRVNITSGTPSNGVCRVYYRRKKS